jgi:hypothetical protein
VKDKSRKKWQSEKGMHYPVRGKIFVAMGVAHGISRQAMNASLEPENRIKNVLCEAVLDNSVISN